MYVSEQSPFADDLSVPDRQIKVRNPIPGYLKSKNGIVSLPKIGEMQTLNLTFLLFEGGFSFFSVAPQ